MSKKSYKEVKCDSLEDVLHKCMDLRLENKWSFRGQRDEKWPLGLHGLKDLNTGKDKDLVKIFSQFKKRCLALPKRDHIAEDDNWRWLFYAQHHRLKTQLLDWTSNPLVAIYFAVEDVLSGKGRKYDKKGNPKDNPFGAVWALKVDERHFSLPDKNTAFNTVPDWFMINPVPITPRLARQSGKFTFHPINDIQPLDERPRRNKNEKIVKFVLKGKDDKNPSREIRRRLGFMNVHHASLFPDADGIADFVTHEWSLLQQ